MAGGSSVDRHSNNASLFGLIEQVNVRPDAPPPRGGILPVEVHAYFQLSQVEQAADFQLRLVLAAETGLETVGEPMRGRATGGRFRVRTIGLPYPPVLGEYTLHVEFRSISAELSEAPWQRQAVAWPIAFRQLEPRPRVTH